MVGNGFKNRFEHPTLIFARFCRYREKKIFQVRNLEILSLICDQKSSANKWTRKNVQHDELSELVAKNRVQNDVLYKKLGIFFKKSGFSKTEDLPKLMFLEVIHEK